jgi:Uma2 family endonuclease
MTALASSIFASPEHFYLPQASWALCRQLVDENPSRRMRLSYSSGRLSVMSPLPAHDRWKRLIGRLVEAIADERKIPIASFGSTTWFREDVQRGIESDECYYIGNESVVRGRTDIDLAIDPPPDLAIEIDVRPAPLDRTQIYADLGVPELWTYDGKVARFLTLNGGRYDAAERSAAFPMITPGDIESQLQRATTMDETTLLRQWREQIALKKTK